MRAPGYIKKGLCGLLAAFIFLAWTGLSASPVLAESGAVYTCVIHPCYAHPVTGEIEDSGGEGSYATGQGMVESAVYTTGILEVTDSGAYYLTIRLSLMDYISNHAFWVQNVGDSGWSAPALGVTGSGSDSNGSTADVCIQVPSENCVIRGSMYVQPMGRDVVFYLYPSDFTAGNATDMNATMVTSDSGAENQNYGGGAATVTPTEAAVSTPTPTPTPEATATPEAMETPEAEAESGQDDRTGSLQNSITEEAAPVSGDGGDETLNDAQGLSLSTEGESETESENPGGVSGARIAELTISLSVSGLILLAAGSGIVYLFLRNWKKWVRGYEDDGDEEQE